MRGEPARTADGIQIQNEVVEYILTAKAGLSRRDIYGERRFGTTVERRYDFAAVVRRACASLGRRNITRALSTALVIVGIAAALAGLELVAIYLAGLAYAALRTADRLPDVLFTKPSPKTAKTSSTVPGMKADEVERRLAIHGEREELRQEKIKEQRKRQERKAKSAQGR